MHGIMIEGDYLIILLSAAINGTEATPPPPNINWNILYGLAQYHKVTNAAYDGISTLDENFRPTDDVLQKFLLTSKKNIAMEVIRGIEIEQIFSQLELHKIRYTPLKGWLLKNLYPKSYMRSMVDVDILVEDTKTELVNQIMKELGYSSEHFGEVHDVYYKKPCMNIEIHKKLIDDKSTMRNSLKELESRLRKTSEDGFMLEMIKEDFYVYLIAHIAKHYNSGGTGIRSIMDVWVYNLQYQEELDGAYLDKELKKIGLLHFAKQVERLSYAWFGGKEDDDFSLVMGQFILSSGAYGNERNAMIKQLVADETNSEKINLIKLKHLIQRVFPDIKLMKTLFPMLDRLPVLLPFFWVIKNITALLFKRERIRNLIKNVQGIDKRNLEKRMLLKEKNELNI